MLHHKFHKLFNPNNVKISYNIKPVINSHDRKKYTRHQLLVKELANASVKHYIL